MRPLVLSFSSLSSLAFLSLGLGLGLPFALIACFGGSPAPAPSVGIDASAPQAVGAQCDPSSPEPCLPSGDPCTGVACDPTLLVCLQFDADGGPTCTADFAPCTTTANCELGLVCGFAVTGGCTAQGQCLNPPVPCEDDAASCGVGPPVCGCNGEPDAIVILGYAASPVASVIACPDGGPVFDAGGEDAGDASDAAAAMDSGD
jgi:hypothetical protein